MSFDVIFQLNERYVLLGNVRSKQAPAQTAFSDAACVAWGFENAGLICGGTPPPITPIDTRGEASAAAAASGAFTRPRSPAAAAAAPGLFPRAPSPVSPPNSRSPSPIIPPSQFSQALQERLARTGTSAQFNAGLRRRDVPVDLAYVRAIKLETPEGHIEVSPTDIINFDSRAFREFIRRSFPRVIVSWGGYPNDESPIFQAPAGSGIAATVLGSAPPPPINISDRINFSLQNFAETLQYTLDDFNSKGITLNPRWSLLIGMHVYMQAGQQVIDQGAHLWNFFPPCLPVQSKSIHSNEATPWVRDTLGCWLFFDTSSGEKNFVRAANDLRLIPAGMTSFLLQHTSPLPLLQILIELDSRRNHTQLNDPWFLEKIGAIYNYPYIYVPETVIGLVVARSTRV